MQAVQYSGHVLGVAKRTVEVVDTIFVALEQGAIPALLEASNQGQAGNLLRRNLVLVQKARQFAIGIENITVLVSAVEVAGAQLPQQCQRLVAREQAGRENGDLALQHFIEWIDGCAAY